MNTARYVVAVLIVVATPPGILLWFAIHPLAGVWRRIGAAWTYVVLTPPTVGIMAATWHFRHALVGADLGTSIPMLVVAGGAAVVAIWIGIQRRSHLTTRILVGVPELTASAYPGTLLTEGIYARIRHPRYVEVTLGVGAYAAFANYSGGYVLLAASIVMLHLVVVLEERELRDRFGDAWTEYARRVPRFVPRLRGRSPTPSPDG